MRTIKDEDGNEVRTHRSIIELVAVVNKDECVDFGFAGKSEDGLIITYDHAELRQIYELLKNHFE